MYTPMASEASAVRSQSVASAGQPAPQDEFELLAATGRRTRADTHTTARQAGSLLPRNQQHRHCTEGEDGHHGKQHGASVPNGSLRQPHIGMSDLIAADPDVPDGFHLRASRATIPPGGTVLGVLTLFDASSYQR